MGEDNLRLLSFLLRHILAKEDGHEFCVSPGGILRQLLKQRLNAPIRAEELSVLQSQIVSLADGEAVKVGVPGGIGHLSRGHGGCRLCHGVGQSLWVLTIRICVHHGGDALRHRGGGHNDDLFVRQPHALLSGHNDILVVGQHEHHLTGGAVHLLQDGLRGGIHSLSAGHDAVHAQIPEGGGQPLAGTHGQKAVPLLCRGVLRLFTGLQLLLYLIQIVRTLRLLTGGHGIVLGAHILDLCQLQCAVFLRLGKGVAGNIRVHMDLEGLVVLTDDQTVADGAEVGPQGLDGGVFPLAHDEYRVKGKGDLFLAYGGEIRLAFRLGLVYFRNGLAPQGTQHTVQDHQIPLSPGVHNAGLLQNRIHFNGLIQCLQTCADGLLQDIFHAVALLGSLCGPIGGQTGNRQHGALGGLHHGTVCGGHTLFHGGGQLHAVSFVHALEVLGNAPEQQGKDDTGISASTPQQSRSGDGGGVRHGDGLIFLQLRGGGLDGQAHVGAGVTVRHGEYIQIVDGFSF